MTTDWFTIVQIASSIALVIITAIYAWVAYKTWGEVKNANRGLVVAKIEPLGVGATIFRIINIGSSVATNIKVSFHTHPKRTLAGEWRHYLLEQNESVRLILRDSDKKNYAYHKLGELFNTLQITICYTDIYKKKHEVRRLIDLKALSQSIKDNLWLINKTSQDELHDIAKNIKDFHSEFRGVVGTMGRVKTRSYTAKDEEQEQKELEQYLKELKKQQKKEKKKDSTNKNSS